jgi:hypothetical protein
LGTRSGEESRKHTACGHGSLARECSDVRSSPRAPSYPSTRQSWRNHMPITEIDVVYLWRYPNTVTTADVTGYKVHALDGDIGKVDKHNDETDSSYLVLSTGPWILGKTVMLPAGVIRSVDRENKTVSVALTKEQIKNAPEYSEDTHESEDYRGQLSQHYGAIRNNG